MSFRSDLYISQNIKVPFFNLWSIISDWRNFTVKQDILDQIQQNTVSVIDLSTDPYSVADVKNKFKAIGLDERLLYLVADVNQVIDDTTIFFPSLMFYRSMDYQQQTMTYENRTFKVSCLNRIPRPHKFYTYLRLLERPYANDIILSFNGLVDSNTKQPIDPSNYDYFGDLHKKFPDVPLYKESMLEDNHWQNDLEIAHPAFTDTYLNIVTETNYLVSFYSEKICKPLASGQLFLLSSGPNSLLGMRQMGFDCFDDVFANHAYDSTDSYTDRIDSMLATLDNVYANIEDVYHANIERIKHNREHFVSDEFRQQLLNPLRSRDLLK